MRVKLTIVGHYDIDESRLEEYYGTDDPEKALAVDLEAFDGDVMVAIGAIEDDLVVSLERA